MLINKEKLINKIATEVHYDTEHPLESYAKLLMMIVEAEEEEAEDKEAVSRGKWLHNDIMETDICSCCHTLLVCDVRGFNYCPYCGAKMDLKEVEE